MIGVKEWLERELRSLKPYLELQEREERIIRSCYVRIITLADRTIYLHRLSWFELLQNMFLDEDIHTNILFPELECHIPEEKTYPKFKLYVLISKVPIIFSIQDFDLMYDKSITTKRKEHLYLSLRIS